MQPVVLKISAVVHQVLELPGSQRPHLPPTQLSVLSCHHFHCCQQSIPQGRSQSVTILTNTQSLQSLPHNLTKWSATGHQSLPTAQFPIQTDCMTTLAKKLVGRMTTQSCYPNVSLRRKAEASDIWKCTKLAFSKLITKTFLGFFFFSRYKPFLLVHMGGLISSGDWFSHDDAAKVDCRKKPRDSLPQCQHLPKH